MNQTTPPISKPKARRVFNDEFKRETIQHWVKSGKPASQVAHELSINPNLLFIWRKRLFPDAAGGRAASGNKPDTLEEAQAQLQEAQQEIALLREQRDILKKTLGIISQAPPNGTNESTK